MTALAGIRIVDFSRFLPGPYCSLVLADLGADVIRIEQPREVAKKAQVLGHDKLSEPRRRQAAAREIVSRNKRSVLLDLRNAAARAAVVKLLEASDVLLHDYRPATMLELGLDYDAVRAINPRLIYCAISLAGQSGPYSDLPGHDPIALALAGALGRFGGGADAPHIPGVPANDIITATHAAIAILAALRAREVTGQGQLADIAMSDCALGMMTSVMQRYLTSGAEPPLAWQAGNVGVWRTRDGKFVCTTDLEPAYWERFCKAIGRDDLAALGRDSSQRATLEAELARVFATRTRDEWFELLHRAGTQVAPVYTVAEALADPHARARGTVVDVEDPQSGPVTHIASPIKLSATPARIRHVARAPGTDTEAVLREIGLTDDEISRLHID